MFKATKNLSPPKEADVKIITIGSSGAGKTTLITRYVKPSYFGVLQLTIGIGDILDKKEVVNNKEYTVMLWDTAGQERFLSTTSLYYRGVDLAIIVYDVTNRKSFEKVSFWLEQFKNADTKDATIILVGNKIDLADRKVTLAEAEEFCRQNNLRHYLTSALRGDNVEAMFTSEIKEVIKNKPSAIKTTMLNIANTVSATLPVSGCCGR